MRPQLTLELLQSLFDYQNGELFWQDPVRAESVKRRREWSLKARPFSATAYRYIFIDKRSYPLHRAIFVYHYDSIDDSIFVDHIDNDRRNNRIENLRLATKVQNQHNTTLSTNNTSGIKGVSWKKSHQSWAVSIFAHGRYVFRANFKDLELAELAAIEARDKYHDQFARS